MRPNSLKIHILAISLLSISIFSTSCSEDIIRGCTDIASTNYNANATEDDGNCMYARDPFIGSYLGELYCPTELALLNVDTITFEILENVTDISLVTVAFTNSSIEGITFDAEIIDNKLTINQLAQGLQISIQGIDTEGDVTGEGTFSLSNDLQQISGPLNIRVDLTSPLPITLKDNCTILARKQS